MMTSLTSESFTKEIKAAPCVVLHFWTAWCGPCFAQEDNLNELEKSYPNVTFRKVNCEENPDIASEQNITAVPTLVIYKSGKPVKKLVGLQETDFLKETFKKL